MTFGRFRSCLKTLCPTRSAAVGLEGGGIGFNFRNDIFWRRQQRVSDGQRPTSASFLPELWIRLDAKLKKGSQMFGCSACRGGRHRATLKLFDERLEGTDAMAEQ
jgi:hypothetical protein